MNKRVAKGMFFGVVAAFVATVGAVQTANVSGGFKWVAQAAQSDAGEGSGPGFLSAPQEKTQNEYPWR